MRALFLALALAGCTAPTSSSDDDTVADSTDGTSDSTPAATESGETAESDVVLPEETGCDPDPDLLSDPANCGACARTCVLPRAEAACVEGACAIGTCASGWAHCDDDIVNGCETEITCVDLAPCTTTCGTEGTISCDDPCEGVCENPAETCNAVDDDCDEACDEGPIPGCRQGVHRSYRGGDGHRYNPSLPIAQSWGLESQDYFYLYAAAAVGLRPFFECRNGDGWFYSESNDCEGTGGPQATIGFISPVETCGAIPLYRVRNPNSGLYFYTKSAGERATVIGNGWQDEGIAGWVWNTP